MRALDSLVLQSFKDWEVICIDECSKDSTVEVVCTYAGTHKDSRIILLRNEKNSGPGVSRNNGIAIAKGDYLCFLDADDFYDSSTFSVLDKRISQTGADIVFYGCNQIIGKTVRKRPVLSRNSISDYLALVGGSFWGGTWNRTLWDGISIPAISNAEDIAVIPILISRAKTIVSTEELLYNYVHSNASISNRHHPQVSYNFIESFHYTLKHIDVQKYREAVEFHGVKTIIYGATLNALKAGMKNEEIKSLWAEFEKEFPYWKGNQYLKSYSRSKRVFVWLASKKAFVWMRAYAHLHNLALKKIG